jgi:iron complex transport system ATP-binding protein
MTFAERYFNQLSGGEKQRVLIARALVQETSYILMDESLSFLDINHQIEILSLLQDIIKHEQKTIIMISHNLNLAAEFADRIVFLKKGEVVAIGTPQEVYNAEVLEKVFETRLCMIENPYTGVQNIVYKKEN